MIMIELRLDLDSEVIVTVQVRSDLNRQGHGHHDDRDQAVTASDRSHGPSHGGGRLRPARMVSCLGFRATRPGSSAFLKMCGCNLQGNLRPLAVCLAPLFYTPRSDFFLKANSNFSCNFELIQNPSTMKSSKSAALAVPSLRPKSEVWIQRELNVAASNAQKNRSIPVDCHAARPASSSKKCVLTYAPKPDALKDDPQISRQATSEPFTVRPKSLKSSTSLEDLESSINKGHSLNSNQEGNSTGISSLQTQLHNIIGEWSCSIKQAIFPDDMGLNESRHSNWLTLV